MKVLGRLLITAMTMVFCAGCAAQAATVPTPVVTTIPIVTAQPTPVTTPAPTPNPTPTPEPTREVHEDYVLYAKEYCEKYGIELTPQFREAFHYAMWTLPKDYSNVNLEIPADLYQYPYSLWTKLSDPRESKFKTNAECIAAYGIDEITQIMQAAKRKLEIEHNSDYVTIDQDAYLKAYSYYLPTEADKKTFAKDILSDILEYQLAQKVVFLTDPSLVYQAPDGAFRVRGRWITTMVHMLPEYFGDDTQTGVWYYADDEISVIPDTPSKHSKYQHGKYVVNSFFNFVPGWHIADQTNIALAEKYYPAAASYQTQP